MLTLASAPLCKDEIVKFERAVCQMSTHSFLQVKSHSNVLLPKSTNFTHGRYPRTTMAAAC